MQIKIKIGISACLIGENVRWDGDHKQDYYLTDTLGRYVAYVPVCPEVECGLGVPRQTLHLEGHADAPRLVTTGTPIDHTQKIKAWAKKRLKELEQEDLYGFIFKSHSPSCGMASAKVYDGEETPKKKGAGLFARAFMDYFPRVPAEEESGLHDPDSRENFIEAIFTMKSWRDMLAKPRKMKYLMDFHTRHKLLFLSHGNRLYHEMGRLVASGADIPISQLYGRYEKLMMETLSLKATIKKNINVLQHIMGYFKNNLSADEKAELLELIEHYRKEHIPLIVPMTLINHYVRKYKQPYLSIQVYLNPHPIALKLLCHL